MAYSNSPLAVMTKISPFNSGTRNHAIDTITPHCVVGQASIESLCNLFQTSGASCNYGIGTDGRVGTICPEEYRSWCTSSPDNDHRAITIECASDNFPPYAFNDRVWASLVNLCIDICKRNGKKTLLWLGSKEKTLFYSPKADEMVLTAHRWFAAKSCPGDWMYAREGQLAEQVTKALGGTTSTPAASVQSAPVASFPVENQERAIWDFLIGKGLNKYAAAGLMGNLYAESGLNPQNLQNSFEKKLGMNDAQYTQAVDSGSYTNFATDSAGYGLAQWTYHTRKQSLLHYARSTGQSIGALSMQLAFLWQELQGYTAVINTLKNASSVRMASDAVLAGYEKPADQSEAVKAKRASFGQVYFDKYAGKISASSSPTTSADISSYRVRITADVLMIRKGAGTNYPAVGKIADRGVYTIVAESTGTGAAKWGKLKSGAGWIALDYTARL